VSSEHTNWSLHNSRESISFHLGQSAALVVLDTLGHWSFGKRAYATTHSVALKWINLSHGINLNLRSIFLVILIKSKSEFIIVIQHGFRHNRVFHWDIGIGYREFEHTATVSPHIQCIV